MYIEVFVHLAHLEDLFAGKPINCKINYASQYDMRLSIKPKKYVFIQSNTSNSNLITIRRKKLKDYLRFKKRIR